MKISKFEDYYDHFLNILYKNATQMVFEMERDKLDQQFYVFKLETIVDSDVQVSIVVDHSIYQSVQVKFSYTDNKKTIYPVPYEFCNYNGTWDDNNLKEKIKDFANSIMLRWEYDEE